MTDLINLYSLYGFTSGGRPTHLVHRTTNKKGNLKVGSGIRRLWQGFLSIFTGKRSG